MGYVATLTCIACIIGGIFLLQPSLVGIAYMAVLL